jgi:hypothetical protein
MSPGGEDRLLRRFEVFEAHSGAIHLEWSSSENENERFSCSNNRNGLSLIAYGQEISTTARSSVVRRADI